MNILWVILPIWLAYIALTGVLDWGNFLLGLAVATGIAWLLHARPGPVAWHRLPRAFYALGRYLLLLAYDLVVNGIEVARIVLSRSLPIAPGIVAIPSNCQSELATALSAHAISLSPGELVVEIDQSQVMYTHCLDAEQADRYVVQAQELRRRLLADIFI
jgi:multicomponent Na+:H+ antiporter subunit E